MPSAANAKSEKPASSEAVDNSPVRQIMTVIEHKIRNLEKRKSKLTSYRDLQKAGKELNGDQKVAVAKYDEVVQTLEFARDLSKQISSIATVAEREAKKQAKKEGWMRYTSETNKIREVLLILDCLTQMGNSEAREDFMNGHNGAAKLSAEDLKILDDLYPEVTPKHELNEEGQSGFHNHTIKAAEHLYAIIDGKPKEVLGTTYAHIKKIVTSVQECGYFEKVPSVEGEAEVEAEAAAEEPAVSAEPPPAPAAFPVPPAPAVVPAPAYPLRPLPPITLQEVEHAYFAQQYPQQRPISEVIGSQNFFFLQESEIDSPAGTPQPPLLTQASPPAPIPSQTFTNQHFVPVPQPHFPPHPDHFAGVPLPPAPPAPPALAPEPQPPAPAPPVVDEWKENQSPERDEASERKTQGQGDGQRHRRYGRGRAAPNGYRGGRGPFQTRQNSDYHREYPRQGNKDYQNRQYDGYQRHGKEARGNETFYGNGDAADAYPAENGRGERGGERGARGRGRARASRPRPPPHFPRRME